MTKMNDEWASKIHEWNNSTIFCQRFKISDFPNGTMLDILIKVGMFESKTRARKQNFIDEPLVPGVHFFKKGFYLFELIP